MVNIDIIPENIRLLDEQERRHEAFNWRCFFGLYPWGKWFVTDSLEAVNVVHKGTTGFALIQRRDCERCGLKQPRRTMF